MQYELKEGQYFFYDKYRLIRQLGHGGFSEVWLAEDLVTTTKVAIKVYVPNNGLDTQGIENFRGEYNLVSGLNHTNLLKTDFMHVWEQRPFLVMPYCANGSIFDKYIKNGNRITEQDCWRLLDDVSAGLAYLHERNVVHKDIKPDNILISDDEHYMITDFGISVKMRDTMTVAQRQQQISGTFRYMPPEYFSSSPKPVPASDIWSLGAMMYELMTGGDAPFSNHGGLLQKNGAEIPVIESGDYSRDLKNVVYKCLANDKKFRPTADRIKKLCSKKLSAFESKPVFVPNIDTTEIVRSENDVLQSFKKLFWSENARKLYLGILALVLVVGGGMQIVKRCGSPNIDDIKIVKTDSVFVSDIIKSMMTEADSLVQQGDSLMRKYPGSLYNPEFMIDSIYIRAIDVYEEVLRMENVDISTTEKIKLNEQHIKNSLQVFIVKYSEWTNPSLKSDNKERKDKIEEYINRITE